MTVSNHNKTADELYTELSLYYNDNYEKWNQDCKDIGTLKESLELETDRLYMLPLHHITESSLNDLKESFESVRNRLKKDHEEMLTFHPRLQQGIVQIKLAIDAQSKENLKGLDPKLQEKAEQLALIAKENLQALELADKYIILFKARFGKRLEKDAEARWTSFCTAAASKLSAMQAQTNQAPSYLSSLASWIYPSAKPQTTSSNATQASTDDACAFPGALVPEAIIPSPSAVDPKTIPEFPKNDSKLMETSKEPSEGPLQVSSDETPGADEPNRSQQQNSAASAATVHPRKSGKRGGAAVSNDATFQRIPF